MPLILIGTPIGNLGDLSPRARETLETVDVLLCEDTRHTRKLLSATGIESPVLLSYHSHNEASRVPGVMERLKEGQRVGLVSDAGMPLVSDPGREVVAAAHVEGHPVQVIPGPSSVLAAVAGSGLAGGAGFAFLGFPPRKQGELERWVKQASQFEGALVVLESGRRVGKLIQTLSRLLPDRSAALCRELTKVHEEIRLAPLGSLPTEPQRGEVVLVIGPGARIESEVQMPSGPDLKSISAVLAQRWGCSRREAYARIVALEASETDR